MSEILQMNPLTQRNIVLLEKLIGAQLVSKFSALTESRVSFRVHKNPPVEPILSQMNPAHYFPPYLSNVLFNIILPFTSRSSKCYTLHIY